MYGVNYRVFRLAWLALKLNKEDRMHPTHYMVKIVKQKYIETRKGKCLHYTV